MSHSKLYRDQPVEQANRKPRRAAYACFTQEDYIAARDCYHTRYVKLVSEIGPWNSTTFASLNNYIIALIKLCEYEEAEQQCRHILALMTEVEVHDSSCFLCLQCNLAASFYLSGKLVAAEELFTRINSRKHLGNALFRDYFDVLSLVRLSSKDCLVFRESAPKPSVLYPVTDYVDQLEGERPKKTLFRSGLKLLRRLSSLRKHRESIGTAGDTVAGAERRSFLIMKALHPATAMFDFEFEKQPTRSKLTLEPLEELPGSPNPDDETAVAAQAQGESTAASLVPGASALSLASLDADVLDVAHVSHVADASDVVGVDPTVDAGEAGKLDHLAHAGDVVQSTDEVMKWLNQQKLDPPIPDEPSSPHQNPNVLDAAIGYTFRSMETTTSSIQGLKPQNQLEITAWASEIRPHYPKHLTVLLDDGADKNSVSEDFVSAIHAPVQKANKVHMITANGQEVEVLGRVMIGFSWKGPSATRFAKIRCYVVKNLAVGMLVCAAVTAKLKLRDSPSLLAPLLFNPRTKQAKTNDAQKSKQVADAAKAQEQREAAQRKADRTKLEDPTKPQRPQTHKARPRFDSLLGGSDTSSASPKSSLTGFDRSTTSTPTDRTSRTGTSLESQRSYGSLSHRRSKAVPCLRLGKK